MGYQHVPAELHDIVADDAALNVVRAVILSGKKVARPSFVTACAKGSTYNARKFAGDQNAH